MEAFPLWDYQVPRKSATCRGSRLVVGGLPGACTRRVKTTAKRLGMNAPLARAGLLAPITAASVQLQSFTAANRLLPETTRTAPPRNITRFAMMPVTTPPT